MTSSRVDRLFAWYSTYDFLGYYSGNEDSDRDGRVNSADVNDGDGVDCRGAIYLSFEAAWAPAPPPFPLLNTSGLSVMGRVKGLLRPLGDRLRGDLLIHASNGQPENSGGPVGHVELDGGHTDARGRWDCYGSSGSGRGVGMVWREPAFWLRRIRIPGLYDDAGPPPPPIITPADVARILSAIQPPLEEDPMSNVRRIPYLGELHTFYPDQGRLMHKWDKGDGAYHVENMRAHFPTLGNVADDPPNLAISADGGLLVGILGADGVFNDLHHAPKTNAWSQFVGR